MGLSMFNIILLMLCGGGIAYFVYRVVTRYQAATGSVWERLLATAKGSATVLLSYAQMVGGFVIAGAEQVSTLLNQPEITSFIQAHVPPQWLGLVLLVMGLITLLARLRTLA